MSEDDRPGHEPDPRFTFANERTFLAWNRTALALLAAGMAVVQFLDVGLPGGALTVALPLLLLGALTSFSSYRRWQVNERALRLGQPLPESGLPRVLAVGIVLVAVAAGAILAYEVIAAAAPSTAPR